MRRNAIWAMGLSACLLFASASDAARFTTRLDALEALLVVRQADAATTGALKKAVDKSLKKLANDTTSLAAEVKTALKVIGSLETKAAEDAAIQAAGAAAINGLATDVTAALTAAEAEAAALAGKTPVEKINACLAMGRGFVTQFASTAGLKAGLQLLSKAAGKVAKAEKAIVKAGGGGGGGGTACGPPDPPAGLKALGARESAGGEIIAFDGTYTFAGDSRTARVHNFNGLPGVPDRFESTVFDCDRQTAFQFTVPYPPTTGVDVRNGPGGNGLVSAGYQSVWDGFTQVFPSGVTIHIDSFDEASKRIVGHVRIPGFAADFAFTIENWVDERR